MSVRAALPAIIATIALGAPAGATMFAFDATSPDPYAEGATCSTPEVLSYGSYIYSYPSRYDGVYWPHTEVYWIWRCPESGYASLGHDFEPRSEEERARVAEFLSGNRPDEALAGMLAASATDEGLDHAALLDWLEAIYGARQMPDEFWSFFYRLRAHLSGDQAVAEAYRARAAPFLEARLTDGETAGMDLIQTLFLLGYYARRRGELDRSEAYFSQARGVEWTDDDGAAQVGAPYFEEMIAAVEAGELDDGAEGPED